MLNVAVVYYSSTGNVHRLADAAAVSAKKAGAEVRLRRVAEVFPQSQVDSNDAWAAHLDATRDVPVADLDDLEWADAILFGTPTRFGLPAAQLKQFLDTTVTLSLQGRLVNKVVSSFTSTSGAHSGQESTILALNNTYYHWGAVIVPTGATDPVLTTPGNGNPYGVSSVSGNRPGNVSEENLAAMEFQARRVTGIAAALKRGFAVG
ncbi:NAD(P)H:quinone oxidoreductase [Streptomyces sp. SID10853]|uniref:NAD(P)H:quinone oxidoreductase n=1 Tax=Streptomyces sp. SID10853 TaxID=2706028 RepID=UPI0013C06B33|nr:NAD(P)H:quinone oxidoreductase [Streptomyces sp. SID10853]NDZ80057.1 NAD(P)H:quinone oxidoreductase [Streptomyces sp. SID10853]